MIWPQHNDTSNVTWRRLILVLMVLFLFTLLFSLSAMTTDQRGVMMNCPFERGMSSMCPMTVANHFSTWRELWLAVTPGQAFLLVFIALAVVVGPLVSAAFQRFGVRMHHWRYRWQLSYQPIPYLTELYADGIIQPRLYA